MSIRWRDCAKGGTARRGRISVTYLENTVWFLAEKLQRASALATLILAVVLMPAVAAAPPPSGGGAAHGARAALDHKSQT